MPGVYENWCLNFMPKIQHLCTSFKAKSFRFGLLDLALRKVTKKSNKLHNVYIMQMCSTLMSITQNQAWFYLHLIYINWRQITQFDSGSVYCRREYPLNNGCRIDMQIISILGQVVHDQFWTPTWCPNLVHNLDVQPWHNLDFNPIQ